MKTSIRTTFLLVIIMSMNTIAQTATAPSGSGTVGDPYQISSLANLYWIAASDAVVPSPSLVTRWSSHYLQTVNIDASATGLGGDWGSEGWTPIGNFTNYFTGTYNGNSHTIDGLYILRPGVNVQGLFGVVFLGTVENLGVTNINFTAGTNVGGITGYLYNESTMNNCFTTGTVTGSGYVAGLTGNLHTLGVITNSYSACTVTSSGQSGGGIVGRSDQSTISNCYSTGSVSANEYAGGLVAFLYDSDVAQSYSSGAVTGSMSLGGLIGAKDPTSSVDNSFWDTEASGRASSAGGTGKTTAEMKTQTTFTAAGWNFTSTWEMIGSNYPRLANLPDASLPVELSSFSATVNDDGVMLAWQTATELNNHGFEVERKELNQSTNESMNQWQRIGFIEGHGTTNAPQSYSFIDASPRGTVHYRLKQIDRDGKFEYSQSVEVVMTKTPKNYALLQNYPNPFNPATRIQYQIPVSGFVTLKVYDMLGKEVATLVNGVRPAGENAVEFNAATLPSGLYFYSLRSNNFTSTKKMLLIR